MNFPPIQPAKIESPCINVCTIDRASQLCVGCLRTAEEIMRWRELSDAERHRYMDDILPARAERLQP